MDSDWLIIRWTFEAGSHFFSANLPGSNTIASEANRCNFNFLWRQRVALEQYFFKFYSVTGLVVSDVADAAVECFMVETK